MTKTINPLDFLKDNLHITSESFPTEVNMAFYSGSEWVESGEAYDIIRNNLENGLTWRVLINSDKALNTFTMYKNELAREKWKALMDKYPHELLVRECDAHFLHTYHSVKIFDEASKKATGKSLVEFFLYDKQGMLKSSGSEILEAGSERYEIFDEEFEYLWEISKPL